MGKLWRGLLWVAALLIVIGLIARATLVDVWTLSDDPKMSAAVAPTLAGGDTILFLRHSKPSFGDLVRCADPDAPNHFVVGRVVGLAGDTVETNGRELSVNGKRYIGEMACAEAKVTVLHPTSGSPVDLTCDQVEIAGHPHFRGASAEHGGFVTPTRNSVGQGMVYLLSDDRTYHDDSRDFGALPADSCSGRIVFRLWGKEGWGDDKHRMTFVQ